MAGMDHILSKGFLATGGSVAYSYGQLVKCAAGALLDPNQVALAVAGTDNGVGKNIIGIVQENLDAAKVNTGKAYVDVALMGVVDCIWDGVGTPVVGGHVVPSAGSTNGTVAFTTITATWQGKPLVGVAVGSAGDTQSGLPGASGDLFKVLLTIGAYF